MRFIRVNPRYYETIFYNKKQFSMIRNISAQKTFLRFSMCPNPATISVSGRDFFSSTACNIRVFDILHSFLR